MTDATHMASISVIIPAFNEADYIPETLKRLAAAERLFRSVADAAVQIVLVDNGSTDQTSELAQSAGATDDCKSAGTELFGDPIVRSYRWVAEYSAREYKELLGTYSDHISLPEVERSDLFSAIVDLIHREYSGKVRKHYETVSGFEGRGRAGITPLGRVTRT